MLASVIVLAPIGLSLVLLHVWLIVFISHNMTVMQTEINPIFSNFIIEKAFRISRKPSF